ncbi:S66 peptidase family protein [Bdellovibrio reynosensis]|uniref:LD-carboxypeptidase n=1 Tax=Bdellovibrio reynosensis TaxID=2835041 RepID=A0ABY4C8J7_9BACT|nr:LD-carboxypeptidase [Bdellovibrio reynosensis]UOE99950.1 LD-carboxypeptidase [Bdellovibrio reynosensis]
MKSQGLIKVTDMFESKDENLERLGDLQLKRLSSDAFFLGIGNKFQKDDHLMALKGGYEAIRHIDKVKELIKVGVKSLSGHSDLTTTLLALMHSPVHAIHGPMFLPDFTESKGVESITWDSYSNLLHSITINRTVHSQFWRPQKQNLFVDWFSKERFRDVRPSVSPREFHLETNITRKFCGIAIGGNLSIFLRQCGTHYLNEFYLQQKNILFLEEWSSPIADVLNMLYYLKLKGTLKNTNLICFGSICPTEYSTSIYDHSIFKEIADLVGVPCVFGVNFGHVQPQYSFLLGKMTQVEVSSSEIEVHQRLDSQNFS